jgi:signal transduction histidine kinase/FixJ family two-component response regulator
LPAPPGHSVVIADNNEFYRQVLGDFYAEIGFSDVRVARDGIETLEILHQRRPDLLVLDLIMPRIDGARLCTFLRSQERYRDLPVIVLSGILADEIENVGEIHADAYIGKMPFEQIRDTLQSVTETLLSGKRPGLPGAAPMLRGFEKMYRREVVLELLQQRKTSGEILDSLSEGIGELSSERRLLSSNRALEDVSGRPACDLLSRPLEEIFSEGRDVLAGLFRELGRGAAFSQAALRHQGRDLLFKLHRLGPVVADAEGTGVATAVSRAAHASPKVRLQSMINSIGFTVLVEDISRRMKAERERECLRERLAQSEKLSAIGLFASGAAHELNNPLTGVLGYSQLLREKHKGTPLAQDLAKIADGASRCKTILENLMVFARCVKPRKTAVDLNELLLETVSEWQDRLRVAGAELVLDLSPDLPMTLADPDQARQAIGHIVDNAVKALADSGAGRRELAVSSRAASGRIRIEFADTGAGIPENVIRKVFDPFFTTRDVGRGTGLGLSAAHGIMAAHGGGIMAANRPGGGAMVAIEFPIVEILAGVERGAPAATAATGTQSQEASRRRILVVDDEAVVVELLADILETDQHQIDVAGDGMEGLRKIRSDDYDLVILDLRLPDMTGQQLYDEVARQRPEMLGRLMFVTADRLTPDVAGFLKRVGNPCLTKPFSVRSVVETVQAMLAGNRLGRSA